MSGWRQLLGWLIVPGVDLTRSIRTHQAAGWYRLPNRSPAGCMAEVSALVAEGDEDRRMTLQLSPRGAGVEIRRSACQLAGVTVRPERGVRVMPQRRVAGPGMAWRMKTGSGRGGRLVERPHGGCARKPLVRSADPREGQS